MKRVAVAFLILVHLPGVLLGQAAPPAPAGDAKPKYYVETNALYTRFTPNGPSWEGADGRLIYRGARQFTPFAGFAALSSPAGSQGHFGAGSYLYFTKRFYTIVGFGVARNSTSLFFPRARFDVAAMYTLSKPKALVLTAGFSELRPYRVAGAGGRLISLGGIYYHRRAIVSATASFNQSVPGGHRSRSAQLSVMRGAEGRYWLTAGAGGGGVAYQLMANVPFDVRYNSFSDFVSFQKWVSRRCGFLIRYDYQRAFQISGRHSLKPGLFFEL